MARPEQCSHCNKKATIHFSQIVNNKVYKLDMCEECPLKKEVIDPGNFSISEIFDPQPKTAKIVADNSSCPSCGFTYKDFEKRGRLGCPDCFNHFTGAVDVIVKDMHYGVEHNGKAPEIALKRVGLTKEITQVRNDLDAAITNEDFEQAAILRDKIVELEESMTALSESKA